MGRPVVGGSADTSDGGGVVSTSGAASATRSDHRIRKIRLSPRAIKSASASVFVARRSPSSLHWTLDQSAPDLGRNLTEGEANELRSVVQTFGGFVPRLAA